MMLNPILKNRYTNIPQSTITPATTKMSPEKKKILCLPRVRGLPEKIDKSVKSKLSDKGLSEKIDKTMKSNQLT